MAVKTLVASARCNISCLITLIIAASQACTRTRWAGVRPSSVPRLSENCAYRYSHINPVLDFARLTQQIHQLLAGIHLQHRLSRWITRHVARHRHRLTPRMPLRASQTEVGVSRPLVAQGADARTPRDPRVDEV